MHLNIETSNNQGASINLHFNNIILSFDNHGWWSQRREVDGYEVEVNIALYPSSDYYFPGPSEVNIGNITEN